MTKRLSLIVTFDRDTETLMIDDDALKILFPDGSCWDDDQERWVDAPELVDEVTRRLLDRLGESERAGSTPSLRRPVTIETRFVELALNIIDPDGTRNPDETLEFGDAARVYLSAHPLTTWEIEGAFDLAAQFVHDWALGQVQVVEGTSYEVGRAVDRSVPPRTSPATKPVLELRPAPSGAEFLESTSEEWLDRVTLETQDPLSGATLRLIAGEYEGVPAVALFVGEESEPILIDRSALYVVAGEGSDDIEQPLLSFKSNADHELEAIVLDVDLGPTFD
jgi:hypothetical protein